MTRRGLGWKEVDKRGPIYTVVPPDEMQQIHETCGRIWGSPCSCMRYPGTWCNSMLREVRNGRSNQEK
jgi:hypothetical protein